MVVLFLAATELTSWAVRLRSVIPETAASLGRQVGTLGAVVAAGGLVAAGLLAAGRTTQRAERPHRPPARAGRGRGPRRPAGLPLVAERAVKAGLVTGLRRFELVEVPEPVARPGVAVAAIALCGICGTDVHGFASADPYNPAICGHEWVGTVIATGDGVTNVAEGDRVVPGSAPACGACPECRSGRPDYCARAFLGVIGRDALAPPHGAFAPRLALDARRLVPVPSSLTDVQAAVVEPTTVALHAVRRTPPRPGGTVVVQGCGPIGLLTLQCARAEGAEHLIAVEPDAGRRRPGPGPRRRPGAHAGRGGRGAGRRARRPRLRVRRRATRPSRPRSTSWAAAGGSTSSASPAPPRSSPRRGRSRRSA